MGLGLPGCPTAHEDVRPGYCSNCARRICVPISERATRCCQQCGAVPPADERLEVQNGRCQSPPHPFLAIQKACPGLAGFRVYLRQIELSILLFGFGFGSNDFLPSTCMINDLNIFYGDGVFPTGLFQQGNHRSFVLDAL